MELMTRQQHRMTPEERNSFYFGIYNIVFTNDCTISMIYNVTEMVRKRPDLYKGAVKYRLKLLRKSMKDYNRVLARLFNSMYFVADIQDMYEDIIKDDMQKLRITTINYMHKCKIQEAELWTDLELSWVFVLGANHNIDANKEIRKHIKHTHGWYEELRMKNVMDAYRNFYGEVRKVLYKDDGTFCDLNENEDIYRGFFVVAKKLADPQLIAKVIKTVDGQNEGN